MKHELQSIISGTGKVRHGAAISAAARYLKGSKGTSPVVENYKHYKNKETEKLKSYIQTNHLWLVNIDFEKFVSEGAEQKVYLVDGKHVLKLNDVIYYNSWVDYFHNLLLHNYFFEDTAYTLEGFYEQDKVLYAVVKQPFVKATAKTNLESVKDFMIQNGFTNERNNDYINRDLGIILEDLHDENVLTQNGLLQFIDTVFYLTPEFYIST